MNESERGTREHLERITRDRETIAHERALLDGWEKSLDREERMARRALEAVDESGQVRLLNPVTQRPFVPQTKPDDRAKVLDVFHRVGPALDRHIPQIELQRHTGLTSGTLSRCVRDLEGEGKLYRVGRTGKGSPIWSDMQPAGDPR